MIQLGPLHYPTAVEDHEIVFGTDVTQGIGKISAAEVAPKSRFTATLRTHEDACGVMLGTGFKDAFYGTNEADLEHGVV